MAGKVYLVGAGPGDPSLITVKGKILLEICDVVLYDALIPPAIMALVNPHAEKIHVGKRRGNHTMPQPDINQLLIAKAQCHAIVVRLKSGDPFMFGRGGEELQDLHKAGISVEVVPGITSGIAGAINLGIPLTHRDLSSSVILVTGHESAGKYQPKVNWQAIAQAADTIIIYMGLHNMGEIAQALMRAGRSPNTPIALIRQVSQPDQTAIFGTLANIHERIHEENFQPPAIAIVGQVVDLRLQVAEISV